jgi:Flp pilus assembly secretin CpaC
MQKTSCITFKRSKLPLILLFVNLIGPAHAQKPTFDTDIEKIFLSKGEQVSLNINKLVQISVGNSEVISKKYLKRSSKLMVKGKKIGFSDLIIWNTQKRKKTFHIFVVSKNLGLKLAQIAKSLDSLNFIVTALGKRIILSGEVDSLTNLKRLTLIKNDFKDKVILELTFTKELTKSIIQKIYLIFEEYNIHDYRCFYQNEISCEYAGFQKHPELEKKITSNFNISLNFRPDKKINSNFIASFKLYQIEISDAVNFSLGLQKLFSNVGELLNQGTRALYEKNNFSLNAEDYQLKLLSSPTIKGRIGEKTQIQVGLDLPFIANSENGVSNTQWRQTGLKVDFTLIPNFSELVLKYKTELSSPSEENIKTNTQESSFLLKQDNFYIEAFKIGMEMDEQKKQYPLGINHLPIIGKLLSSNHSSKSFKYILGFIKIEYIN